VISTRVGLVLIIVEVLAAPCGAASEKPLALRKAAEARSGGFLRTAHMEFSIAERSGEAGKPICTQFFTWKCADDRYILVHREDDEGVFKRDHAGRPVLAFLNKPDHFLVTDGQVWQHTEGTGDAYVHAEDARKPFRLYDMRSIGLNPVTIGSDFDEAVRRLDYPPLRYETEIVDGLHVVTGRTRESMVKWWIDPERAWNVVRTEVFQDGKKIGERRFELKLDLHDGIWFPRRIEHYRLGAGDTTASTVTELHSVEFNRPEHPEELTPADIGIEVGTSVIWQDREPARGGYWDGEKTIPFAELVERIETGELAMGSTVRRARAYVKKAFPTREKLVAAIRGGASVSKVAATQPALPIPTSKWKTIETRWETYTRLFIQRYDFNEEQTQKAWSICADCQGRARAYVAGRRKQFEELDVLTHSLGTPRSTQDKARAARLEARCDELTKPIDRIFEEQLCPRLQRLPTRAQREAVDSPGSDAHDKSVSGE